MKHNETFESLADVKDFDSSFQATEKTFESDHRTDGFSRLGDYFSGRRESARFWFRSMNEKRKWLKQELVWRFKQTWLFHSSERFYSFALVWMNRASGKWRLLKLHPATVHTLFTVCVENTPEGARVVKVPLCSNESSMKLVNALKAPNEFSRYVEILTGLTMLPALGQHCVRVTEARRNGGYSCEHVDGANLTEVRHRLFHGEPLPKSEREALVNALRALIKHVNEFNFENRGIIGDWSLNNLVFEPKRGVIINVDAEGFYTHRTERSWWNREKLEAELGALGELIQLLDSDSNEDSKMAELFTVRDTVQGRGQCGSANVNAHGHSLELNSRRFRGRPDGQMFSARTSLDFSCRCRSCSSRNFVLERLAQVPFDFMHKVVLDLGCHMGDVLHALAGTIRKGYGFDVDPDCVNAAHLTRGFSNATNLEFFTLHPERQDLGLLKCFLLRESVDICFLFATRNWLAQWPQIAAEAAKLSPAMLVEVEDTLQRPSHQVDLLHQYYGTIELVADAFDDDGPFSLDRRRRLYLCTKSKILPAAVTEPGGRSPVQAENIQPTPLGR
ncbi:MAG TPA: hypothetical protein VGY56_14270 [Verrucomicrobiae bacterium]|nr:hypothetical protein [Verrucomicrobiae bacterium]